MAPPSAIAIDSGTVLILITLVVLPIAAAAFAMSGAAWRSIGKGPFAIEQELPTRGPGAAAPPPVDAALQAAEARQMLEAKAYRQRQRGERAIDVEAELARALDLGAAAVPTQHAELEAEIRQLVVARNERRLRQGQEPLDVEAETRRELANLVGSS